MYFVNEPKDMQWPDFEQFYPRTLFGNSEYHMYASSSSILGRESFKSCSWALDSFFFLGLLCKHQEQYKELLCNVSQILSDNSFHDARSYS